MSVSNTSMTGGAHAALELKRHSLRSGVLALIAFWYARHLERQALRRLSAELLTDIGVDEVEARREYNKPFWRD